MNRQSSVEGEPLNHKTILTLAGDILPELEKAAAKNLGKDLPLKIGFEEPIKEIESHSLPDQLHIITSWKSQNNPRGLFIRIGKRETDCHVLTICGSNPDSHVGVIEVNGDSSWIKRLQEELGILFRDDFSCTPDSE